MKRKIFFGVILSIMFAFMMPLFTGCFEKEARLVNVTWCNDDHTVIMEEQYHVGEIPTYKGTLPTSKEFENTIYETWVFNYWTDWYSDDEYNCQNDRFGFCPVPDHDVKYVAMFSSVATKYNFQFKNYDGEVLQNVGEICYQDEFVDNLQLAPKKPAQGNLIYVFKGWDVDFNEFWANDCQNYIDGTVKDVNAVFVELDTTKTTDGVQFTLNDEETAYWVSGYNGQAKDVVIASTHNNLPVEGIEEHAFYENDNIEYVYIAEGIKHIGDEAFHLCYKLKKVYIPNSIESVGERAFYYNFMEHKTYDTCAYLGNDENPYLVLIDAKSHYQESYEIHPDTKVLASRLFYYNEILTSLVIPNGVKNIPNELCFYTKYIEHVTIPASVKSIGNRAFTNCENLTQVVVEGNLEKIDSSAFNGCNKLSTITVRGNVKEIGEYAFSNCNRLSTVNIEGYVEKIGKFAFSNCSLLANIAFNEGLKEIDSYAFKDCVKLANITIPNSIESIEISSFDGCSKLAGTKINGSHFIGNADNPYLVIFKFDETTYCDITIKKDTKVICAYMNRYFHNIYYDGNLEEWFELIAMLRADLNIGGFNAYYLNNEMLQGEIVIPEGTTKIPVYAFKGQTEITSVVLPSSVKKIEYSAFRECLKLEQINIENVEEIGSSAFYSCIKLNNITLSNKLEILSSEIFGNCYALDNIIIPNSVKEIEWYAFGSCNSLTNVIIPSSVENLHHSAFTHCANLKNLVISNGVEEIGQALVASSNENLKIYYLGTQEQWNNVNIDSWENEKFNDIIFIPNIANLANQIKKGNYSLESDSQTYDFDNGKIFFNSNIYVKENNQYVGYKFVAENNKVRYDNVGTLNLSYIEMLKFGVENYIFNGDEYDIAFVNDELALVSNKTFEVDGVEVSNRVIKIDSDNYVLSFVANGVNYEVTIKNIGENDILTPTNDEVSLFFLAMDYYKNFTQNNVVHMVNPYDSKDYGNEVYYKLDGNKVYLQQTSYSQSSTTTRYLSKEGDNYYYYQYYNGQWYKTNITEEQYNQNKSTGISADTRELLFNGSNYTKNGDVYNYTGDDVYFEIQNERYNFDDITLTIDEDVLTISFTVAGGVITGAYTFSNINTTTVEIPTMA